MLLFNNMSKLRRELAHSLCTTGSDEADRIRRAQLKTVPKPHSRLGLIALHNLAKHAPNLTAAAIGVQRSPDKIDHVGSGWTAMVFRKNEAEVVKVVHASVFISPSRRQDMAKELEEKHLTLASHLGSFIVPQTIHIDAHPLFPNRQAVQIVQSYREIADPELFVADSPWLSHSHLQQFQADYPDGIAQLIDLVDRSRRAYQEDRVWPDTKGEGNVVIDLAGGQKSNLCLIDGFPITDNDPDGQLIISNNIDALEAALSLAA